MAIRIDSKLTATQAAELALKYAKRNGGTITIEYKTEVLTVYHGNDLQTLVDWFKRTRGEK